MKIYQTSFCNQGHYVSNGKPVDHECYIIPIKALAAEINGDIETAIEILQTSKLKTYGKIK